MNNYRNPQIIFDAAINQGFLSVDSGSDNYAADYMYMGDDADGKAMFKNIVTRRYIKANVTA